MSRTSPPRRAPFTTARSTGLAVGFLLAACAEPAPDLAARDDLVDPETCADCHPRHYEEWSSSMHAYASDDPVFLAMNRRGQRETEGELGDFCVRCHAPMALLEGATSDGLDLEEVPQRLKGVTCFFCHSVDSVEGNHNNPLHLSGDLKMRGQYADPVENSIHRSAYSPLHDRDREDSAALCGACHDIVVQEQAAIERTFQEWQASVFSGSDGATCGQCHMDQSPNPTPIADAPGVFARRHHGHVLPGVDVALTPFAGTAEQRSAVQALLDTTLQSALCVADLGDGAAIRVILDNVGAGHGFPSGSAQDRRVWTEVVAEKDGAVVYESGRVDASESVEATADPDLWLLGDCMLGADTEPVRMFWEARDYVSTQLPAQATFDPADPRYYQTHVIQRYPRSTSQALDSMPDRVTMRVRVRPLAFDLIDDLVDSGDLRAELRDAVATFDVDLGDGPVLEWTPSAVNGSYLEQGIFEVACVTRSSLDVSADKTPAPPPLDCHR